MTSGLLTDEQIVECALGGFVLSDSEVARLGNMVKEARTEVAYHREGFEHDQAEIKRLRIQLGCVKATAILWEEEADELVKMRGGHHRMGDNARAERARSDAAAIRDMLSETPEDDVVEAVILCGQSSGMFRVAECSLPDGHDGQHEDSNTGWMWGK